MVILLSISSVIFAIIQITSAQSPCKIPDNWNGNCIAIKQCRSLMKLVAKDLSMEQRNFLRNSQCGRDGENILVCCPNTFMIDGLPTTQYCGKQVGNRIDRGPETTMHEFPWMALLHYKKQSPNDGQGFFCAGALIHDNYVITVAHCVNGAKIIKEQYVIDFVRLGEHDLQSNPDCPQQNKCSDPVEDIPVAETIVHENYIPTSRSQEHDIALIRLERAVPYTDFVRPICLPVGKLQNRNYDGYSMVVSGFGQIDSATRNTVKVKVGVNGLNFSECTNVFRKFGVNLTDGMQICTSVENDSIACDLDSGAPLVAEEPIDEYSYLVGVGSFGKKECASSEYPDIYTRVDQYIDWILDHMRK